MTLWSYVTHWLGYLSWCASASDPACRPFVGFLALFGVSAGTLSLLVLGMVGMLNAGERDLDVARASTAPLQRERAPQEKLRRAAPRAEPALGLAAAAYATHAEPLPASSALAMDAEPLRVTQPIAASLRPMH